jgi:hypothetical protein
MKDEILRDILKAESSQGKFKGVDLEVALGELKIDADRYKAGGPKAPKRAWTRHIRNWWEKPKKN